MDNFLHRKESVVLTAMEIIDELGLENLSTREIARRQEISEGTLFKHFRTKNEIILAILDQYAQYDADIISSIRLKKLPPKEAILYFVSVFSEHFEHDPAISAISQLFEVLRYKPELAERIKQIFHIRTQFITEMVEAGQQNGELCEVDGEGLADIIFGILGTFSLKWRLTGKNFPLKEKTVNTLTMILEAFTPGE